MTLVGPSAEETDELGTTEEHLKDTEENPAESKPLGRSAALGALWLAAQKWVVRITGFATIAILTRYIAPEEFGVVAAAIAVTPLVLLMSDLGLATYIVQAERLSTRTLSTAFWFSVTVGVAMALALAALAPLVADAFNVGGSAAILQGMMLPVIMIVLGSVPEALLRRRMEFKLLAIQMTVGAFLAQIVAVTMAVRGFGAWALVAQLLVAEIVRTVWVWRAARWAPSLQFSPREFLAMASFGVKVVAVDSLGTIRVALAAGVISNVLGPAALGYMSVAQKLVNVVQDIGASALVPVSTVVFAKVRESRERLRSGYLRALRIGYAGVSPLLCLVVVGAPEIVPILFGAEWAPSIPVAQALALAGILTLGEMIDHGLHYGVGKPGTWFLYALGYEGLVLAATFVLAPQGLVAVAVGSVFMALLATMARWVLGDRIVHCSIPTLAKEFSIAMAAFAASAAAGLAARQLCSALEIGGLLTVILMGAAVGITHVVMLRLIHRQVLHDLFDLLPLPGRVVALRRFA